MDSSHPQLILEGHDILKSFRQGDQSLEILKGVNIGIHQRESVAIMGSSGSGKSTLLHVLGTIDRPDKGKVLFKGQNLSDLSDRELSIFRRRSLSFIFQAFHLLPHLSAAENVQWPMVIDGKRGKEVRDRSLELLRSVGLEHRSDHLPRQLSGGEMQRVAIARALMNSPEIILADEPTGNLDSKNSDQILELLFKSVRDHHCSLLMVTHDPRSAQLCDRTINLKDGMVV